MSASSVLLSWSHRCFCEESKAVVKIFFIFFHWSPNGTKAVVTYPLLTRSVQVVSDLDAKVASCSLKNCLAMVGDVTGITYVFPRRIHAISEFICFMRLCIHWWADLFASISGRLPTTGHGLGPGGSFGFCFLDHFWTKLGIRAFRIMVKHTKNQRLRIFEKKREGACSMAWKRVFVVVKIVGYFFD